MKRSLVLVLVFLSSACTEVLFVGPGSGDPAPPRSLDGWYFAGAVELTWELSPQWDGEAFRVYGRRSTDRDYFLLAQVTSCIASLCRYQDSNIRENTQYEYYVTAVHTDPGIGTETATAYSLLVDVPSFAPPPVPEGLWGVGMDGAAFVGWSDNARSADDFTYYRIYLEDDSGELFLLGQSDSEGFLDLLAENGSLIQYRVSSLDAWGHESGTSASVYVSPRPDFKGELLFSFNDDPGSSGFRFVPDEASNPVMSGVDGSRHFRVEELGGVWWLVPGPEAFGVTVGEFTTELRCGPGSDAGCLDIPIAPASGYTVQPVELLSEHSYVLRVRGDDGQVHFGVLRVALEGFDGQGRAVVVFDWAYQLRPDDPFLGPGG